jgi:hypothetical protein
VLRLDMLRAVARRPQVKKFPPFDKGG